jgi:hypothetical protein
MAVAPDADHRVAHGESQAHNVGDDPVIRRLDR